MILRMSFPGMSQTYIEPEVLGLNNDRIGDLESQSRQAFEEMKLEAARLGGWEEYNALYGDFVRLNFDEKGSLRFELVEPGFTVGRFGEGLGIRYVGEDNVERISNGEIKMEKIDGDHHYRMFDHSYPHQGYASGQIKHHRKRSALY